MLTVQCPEAVLCVQCAPDEGLPHQLRALRSAVGENGAKDVMMLYSDSPEVLDGDETWAEFKNLLCVAQDPLHIAMRIEKATSKKQTIKSGQLRVCLNKLRFGIAHCGPYYRKGDRLSARPALPALMNHMARSTAASRVRNIKRDGYSKKPYTRADTFLKDVTAICVVQKAKHTKSFSRKTANMTTVL